jgi:hypothetical protein
MTSECLKPCFRMVRTTLALGLLLVAVPSSLTFAGPFEDASVPVVSSTIQVVVDR